MHKQRLEAFSDGVIAVLITIMVLELHAPEKGEWRALEEPFWKGFLAYVLSFVFLGIYWNNHHHMLHTAERVNGRILWANLHLLFWLSLVPFTTSWLGKHSSEGTPTAFYGVVLLLAAAAYTLLQAAIVAQQGPHSRLAAAVGKDRKGKVSMLAYALAIPLAFARPWLADALYVFVALLWLVPDRRIESKLTA
ncbi:MAG TPA: TMEM175 family protein [Planctomycetota bacterium]|nr:TMEM175 family protein [Planctomycetota bacterium]